jgi:hypothetical protein
MTWHLAETRDWIERLFGRDQLSLARPCLKSIVDRQDFARYHYQEARALLTLFADAHLADKLLLDVVMGREPEANAAFQTLMIKIGAHSVACVQSLHSIPDVLAHVLYYSLGLNLSCPLVERKVSAWSMQKMLGSERKFFELADSLRSLTHDGLAPHLAALANHSKHRSIVQPLLSEDATGERSQSHELLFSSFIYESRHYPEITVRELLEPEYERSSQVTIAVGKKLNLVLAELAN